MNARAALLATMLLGGCELIANIPSSTSGHAEDGGGGGDDDDVVDSGSDGGSAAPECITNTECSAAKPTCSAEHVCRACQIDTDCGTDGVCMLDGTCAAPNRIMYASPTGSGMTCSAIMPCAFTQAVAMLSTTLDVIKLAPQNFNVDTVAINTTFPVLVAGEGATLTNVSTAMFAFSYMVSGPGITFTGVTFNQGSLFGRECTGGALTFSRAKLVAGLFAIYVPNPCDVTFERTMVTGQSAYAISYQSGTSALRIRNSLFANIGAPSTGISTIYIPTAGALGEITNTTIANNQSDGNGSVDCGPNAFPLRNVISVGNSGPPSASCAVSYSDVEAGYGGVNNHNVTMDPQFVAATDYHLQPTSPVRGIGDPANVLPFDIDFQPRPQPAGSAPDLGFDEVP